MEVIQSNPQHFNDTNTIGAGRRLSDASMQSTISGLIENVSLSTIHSRKFASSAKGRISFGTYSYRKLQFISFFHDKPLSEQRKIFKVHISIMGLAYFVVLSCTG